MIFLKCSLLPPICFNTLKGCKQKEEDEGLKVDIDCQLVNCVHADTASMAIDKLKKEKSFGIYANSSIYKKNKLEGFVTDSDEWHYHNHQHISHLEYSDFVSDWIDNGASVIGGCCRTTT